MKTLSKERQTKVWSVGTAAAVSLYLLVVFIAEPLRSLAATDTSVVTYNVTSALSITCTDSTIGSVSGAASSGTGAMATAACTPITNNSAGYTLSWLINTSTGSTALTCTSNCYGTGHLLSKNETSGYADKIRAFERDASDGYTNVPAQFDSTTIPTASGSRWAARLRGNSTTPNGGTVTWDADGATEGFLNVATGSAVNIARRNTATASGGDIQNFLFKVVIPSGSFQPTGMYRATILFTATDN